MLLIRQPCNLARQLRSEKINTVSGNTKRCQGCGVLAGWARQAFSKGHSAPQEDAKPSKVVAGRKNSPPVVLHAEEWDLFPQLVVWEVCPFYSTGMPAVPHHHLIPFDLFISGSLLLVILVTWPAPSHCGDCGYLAIIFKLRGRSLSSNVSFLPGFNLWPLRFFLQRGAILALQTECNNNSY